MAFDPQAYLKEVEQAKPAPTSFDPSSYVSETADQLANDEEFDPIGFALDNPDKQDFAEEVAYKQSERPWTKERLQKLPGIAGKAAVGIVKDFGAGMGGIAADVVTQATDDLPQNVERAKTQQMARAQLVENNTETFLTKLFGPNTYLGKLFEGAGANMNAGQAMMLGGAASSGGVPLSEQAANTQQETQVDIAKRNADPRGSFKSEFANRIRLAARERELLKGNVQDTGVVAGAVEMAGVKPTEVFQSGEELAAQGAPVDPEAIRTGAVTADPLNALPMQVPKLAPVLNRVAGAALKAPKALAENIVERIPGSWKSAAGKGVAGAAGAGTLYGAVNDPKKALEYLGYTAGAAAAVGGAKLFGKILDNAGSKMMNPKFVSASEKAAAESLMDINARGGGALSKMTDKALNKADLERVASRTIQGVASAPGGALPLLAAADNPEEAASMVGGAMGFGAMGGLTSYDPVKGFRPETVQAVDTVLRENGAKKTYGTELDGKHNAWMKQAPDWVRDGVNAYRGFFDGFKLPDGKEPQIYVLGGKEFAKEVSKRRPDIDLNLAENQRGLFNPKDGTVLINGDYGGEAASILGHEAAGHLVTENLMRTLAPELTRSIMDSAEKGLLKDGSPTPQLKAFVDAYNLEFDPTGQKKEIETNEHAISEWLAEQARSVVDGEGPAKYAAGESIRGKLADNLGDYFQKFFGTKKKFDRTEVPGIAKEYRNLLFEMGRFGNQARNGENIYEGTSAPAPETPPVTPARPASAQPAPTASPARGPEQINRAARYQTLNLDETALDAARDKAMQEAVDAEKTRRGRRPMSEKSEAEVAETAGKDFDSQLERYIAALESEGVPHPDSVDIVEAIRLNELAPDNNLPKWKGWGGRSTRPAVDSPERVVNEPAPGEPYPYEVTAHERAVLLRDGWTAEEIAAMPKSQVDAEVAAPSVLASKPPESQASQPEIPWWEDPNAPHPLFSSPEYKAWEENEARKRQPAPAKPLAGVVEPESAPNVITRPLERISDTPEPATTPRITSEELTNRLQAAEEAAKQAEIGKKRKNDETRGKATEKAVKEARVRALVDAATEDAAGDPDLLQVRTDTDGKERFTGRLDTSLESHRMLADEMGLAPEELDIINSFQSGKTLYVDYLSAKNLEPDDITGKQRRKEYAANPPEDRGDSTATIQRNKAIIGITLAVSKAGNPIIKGISVDKYLANTAKLLDVAKKEGIGVSYADINDPAILEDLNGYVTNHRNGYKGDGSGPVAGETINSEYVPHLIDSGNFDLLNAAFHSDISSKVDSARKDTRQGAMDAQTRALENNWQVDDETGDTNPFRALINKKGSLTVVTPKGETRTGTAEVLEPVWENLVPDMIQAVKDAPDGERDIVREVGFKGDAGEVMKKGLPNFQNVAAGFLPGQGAKKGALADIGAAENESSIKSKIAESAKSLGVRYDGQIEVPGTERHQFTDNDPESPAYKATFVIKGKPTEAAIQEKLEAKREAIKGSRSVDEMRGGSLMPGKKLSDIKKAIEADEIEPESAADMPKFQGLTPFWLAPDGTLYDGHAAGGRHHYTFAEKYIVPEAGSDALEAAQAAGWHRVNISPSDGEIMTQGGKLTKEQRAALEDLAFSQDLGVMNDDGMRIFDNPNPPEGEENGSRDWFMPGSNKPLARIGEQDELGFTSALHKAITDKLPNKASKEQILATLDPAKSGVKKEELDWMGLPEFLADKKTVTKQELLDFVESNKVELKEVKLGDEAFDATFHEEGDDGMWHVYGERANEGDIYETAEEARAKSEEYNKDIPKGPTKFGNYRLPGGENYKEVLLTLPQQRYWNDGSPVTAEDVSTEHGRETADRVANYGDKEPFHSSHWDEPNVLAHIRQADFTDSDGSKVRVIEEIQSDWMQAMRKKGVKSESNPDGVPPGPFQKTWHELAFKRALRQAVDENFDKLAWVTGDIAAERFDLSKTIGTLKATRSSREGGENDKINVRAYDHEGHSVISESVSPDKLADTVGKDLAEKILSQEPGNETTYEGLDLKSGGQGMRGFYDKIIPDFARKYVKKWGSSVEDVTIGRKGKVEKRGSSWQVTLGDGHSQKFSNEWSAQEYLDKFDTGAHELHAVRITPEMRDSVKAGQPLFMPGKKKGKPLENLGEDESSIQSKIAKSTSKEMDVAEAEPDKSYWLSPTGKLILVPDGRHIEHTKELGFSGDIAGKDEAYKKGYKRVVTYSDPEGKLVMEVNGGYKRELDPQLTERQKGALDRLEGTVRNHSSGFMPGDGIENAAEAGSVDPRDKKEARKAWLEKKTKSPWFKQWFGKSKVTDDSGEPIAVYSGHAQPALYGDAYDPKKTTAGGFYASEDPQIASSYATGKMGVREEYENGSQYRFKQANGKFAKKLWQIELTPEQVNKAREFLLNEEHGVSTDLERYWKDNAPYDADARRASYRGLRDLSNIFKTMESLGNTISYPKEISMPDGSTAPMFMRQTKNSFEELLDHLGIEWQSFDWAQPGVQKLYLKIENPIDAEKPFPADLLKALEVVAKRDRSKADPNHDHWTKDYPIKQWVQDIKDGNEFWSTHIPTKALPIIREFGYDGIKEVGNKSEKDRSKRQVNWIAFEPGQIKSAMGNQGAFDESKPSMLAMPGARRTWFLRDGKRVYHQRGEDGQFKPRNQSLANVAPVGIATSSESDRKKKPLEDFQ